MKTYPLINLPGLDTIEAEKGEVIVNPEGVTFEIDGKPHSRGGTPMMAEDGSFILSRKLKLPKEVVESLGEKEAAMSPADLSRKHRTDVFKDIMDSKDKRYDDLSKKTAALMFEKNQMKQRLIFGAQEEYKKSKGMRNDAEYAQNGLNVAVNYPGVKSPTPTGAFQNVSGFHTIDFNNSRSQGYSEMKDGLETLYNRPFATDSYFRIQGDLLNAKGYTESQKKILGERQARLSNLRQTLGTPDGAMVEREYAKYLREADKIEKDQFLDKFAVLSDGREVPLVQATDAEIESAASFRYKNKRTGKSDLVDLRDRQNQGFDPIFQYQKIPDNFGTTPRLTPKEAPSLTLPPPANVPTKVPIDFSKGSKEVTRGLDMQKVVNGVQMGLLAADLATVRTKPPYYDYRPTELAYTRYEPINTKQQERAFNIAKESIEGSNLPQQVKSAQIANMYGNFIEGVNQVDITNQQNKLANDNRNIDRFFNSRNDDNLRQQDSNLRYVQEADRRNAQAAMQRQVYLDSILNIWNKQVENRRDVGLVNQLSPNFDYDFNGEKVRYQQGTTPTIPSNGLESFRKQIDPRFLNEEGRRAYGYQ